MPRTARVVLTNTPHHVIQRGHNRDTVFASRSDYQKYLATLREWKQRLRVKVHSYCLMTNHVHLILDPGEDPDSLALLMKRLAGRQTRYVNVLEVRTGTLWDGRFRSSPIETDTYLLRCARYIELNPVRAGMVARPEDYVWSSYRAKVVAAVASAIDLDPCFLALGATPLERAAQYAAFVREAISDVEWNFIRTALQRGQLTGTNRFVDEVERRIGRRIEWRGQGNRRGDRSISLRRPP